jgi:hypothetical protein
MNGKWPKQIKQNILDKMGKYSPLTLDKSYKKKI